MIDEVKKFIVWLFQKDEWYYDSSEDLWRQYGYKSRAIEELFEYYKQTKGREL